MVSKKGIVLTGVMLAAITGASFVIWLVPQDGKTTFVVTDFEGYLDGVRNIHEILQESLHAEYQMLLDGNVLPQEYDIAADRTASQITAEISRLVTSEPPAEWTDSYISYMESMRSFNSYIEETRVVSSMIAGGADASEAIQRTEEIKEESEAHARMSDESRP
ncbi:MAG: hypothetical protein EB830_03610 [Nitrosopumilus sp. H13]|nr:MAG: hypothetical protein EB830_03610 [Nitrosopumilus sp. H13]